MWNSGFHAIHGDKRNNEQVKRRRVSNDLLRCASSVWRPPTTSSPVNLSIHFFESSMVTHSLLQRTVAEIWAVQFMKFIIHIWLILCSTETIQNIFVIVACWEREIHFAHWVCQLHSRGGQTHKKTESVLCMWFLFSLLSIFCLLFA